MTTYLYDDFGRMLKQVSPVTGTTTYAYDPAGNLTSTTDANTAMTTRTYDALGRVLNAVSTRTGLATETVTWTYDLVGSPNGVGRLGRMSDAEGTTDYGYDRRGLLAKESRVPAGFTFASTTSYVHDSDGNRQSILYPVAGIRVDYGFDYAQRPVTLTATSSPSSGPVVSITSAEYAPFGPLAKIVFGNGTTHSMTYDPRYRLDRSTLSGPAGVIAQHDYTFDAGSNVTAIADLDSTYSKTFGYDDLNRLVTANTGRSLWSTGEYSYDAMGNIKTASIGLAPVSTDPETLNAADPLARPLSRRTTFTYVGTTPRLENVAEWGRNVPSIESTSSRRIGAHSYLRGRSVTYDAAGNETEYFASRTYSPRNLLARVTSSDEEGSAPLFIEYGYDGRGVRVRRTRAHPEGGSPGTQRYHYSADLRLLVIDTESPTPPPSCAPECAYDPLPLQHGIIWFDGRPVITFDGGLSSARYTLTDHLGTPILQTNWFASVIWHADYEPFGNIYKMRFGARGDQPLRLPGQEAAMTWEGTEENYNIFRWYRTGWGRYTQADPYLQPSAEEPNQYAYARVNPVRFRDSLGLFAIDPSCDCGPRIGNVAQGVAKACSYARKSACADLLRRLSPGGQRLDRCLSQRCTDDTPIKCNNATGACGSYSGLSRTIYLFAGHGGCPNQQGLGLGPTIFHEAIHSCGLFQEPYRDQPLSIAFNEIMKVCTGYNER